MTRRTTAYRDCRHIPTANVAKNQSARRIDARDDYQLRRSESLSASLRILRNLSASSRKPSSPGCAGDSGGFIEFPLAARLYHKRRVCASLASLRKGGTLRNGIDIAWLSETDISAECRENAREIRSRVARLIRQGEFPSIVRNSLMPHRACNAGLMTRDCNIRYTIITRVKY